MRRERGWAVSGLSPPPRGAQGDLPQAARGPGHPSADPSTAPRTTGSGPAGSPNPPTACPSSASMHGPPCDHPAPVRPAPESAMEVASSRVTRPCWSFSVALTTYPRLRYRLICFSGACVPIIILLCPACSVPGSGWPEEGPAADTLAPCHLSFPRAGCSRRRPPFLPDWASPRPLRCSQDRPPTYSP